MWLKGAITQVYHNRVSQRAHHSWHMTILQKCRKKLGKSKWQRSKRNNTYHWINLITRCLNHKTNKNNKVLSLISETTLSKTQMMDSALIFRLEISKSLNNSKKYSRMMTLDNLHSKWTANLRLTMDFPLISQIIKLKIMRDSLKLNRLQRQ